MLDLLDLLEYRTPCNIERHWLDPWLLFFSMVSMTVAAVILLVIDSIEHFMVGGHQILSNFMYRIKLVYETVPYYLHGIKQSRR